MTAARPPLASRLAVTAALVAAVAVSSDPAAAQDDKRAVIAAVEGFLDALGTRDLDRLPALLAPKATIAIARLRDGAWSYTTQTADELLAGLRQQASPTRFKEPLTDVTVHVEDGRLAFVRAHFTIVIDGAVRSHGVDYFTLLRDGAAWRVAHVAYTSKPGSIE